mmetsp:Transcript_115850/g.327805  ORF Transcript_115850/g.327805 Transcript_115850/m.327805 type:complete len:110 (-) Transcript_115850:1116-1445(-)
MPLNIMSSMMILCATCGVRSALPLTFRSGRLPKRKGPASGCKYQAGAKVKKHVVAEFAAYSGAHLLDVPGERQRGAEAYNELCKKKAAADAGHVLRAKDPDKKDGGIRL